MALSMDTTRISKSRKNKENDAPSTKIRLRDLDTLQKNIMKVAISHYRTCISCIQAFPDDAEEQQLATASWANACKQKDVTVPLEEDHLPLVSRFSLLRFTY